MLGTVGLRTPEGRWQVVGDRRPSASFNPDCPSHCVMCRLPGRRDPLAVINAGRALLLGTMTGEWRALELPHGTGTSSSSSAAAASATVVHPSCVAFTPESGDGHDLLVGLSTGEILLFSLAVLAALAQGARPTAATTYNDGAVAPARSRCLSLQWIQGTAGGSFVATHADGSVCVHHRMLGRSSDLRLLSRSNSEVALAAPASSRLASPGHGGAAVLAHMAPGGDVLALAGRDGRLTLHRYPGGDCFAGFKSYYGALTCLAWSADGALVAAGGEDDLITVYDVTAGQVVAVCQGHTSWVAGVAFDPWASSAHQGQDPGPGSTSPRPRPAMTTYRLVSVSQDCHLAMWNVQVPCRDKDGSPGSVRSGASSGLHRSPPIDPEQLRSLRREALPLIAPVVSQRISATPLCGLAVGELEMVLTTFGGGAVVLSRRSIQNRAPATNC